MNRAHDDIHAERARQIGQLGYGSHHDDQYQDGELLAAAACYAYASLRAQHGAPITQPPDWWPWSPELFRPGGARRALVKAGALIEAEIERFDRENARIQAGQVPRSKRLVSL